MTIQWIEGFELERSYAYHIATYADYVGDTAPGFIPGQNSLWAMESDGTPGVYFTTPTLDSHATYVIGFRIQVPYASVSATDRDVAGFNYDGTRHISLGIHEAVDNTHYTFRVFDGETSGGTQLGESAQIETGNGWDYIEIKIYCHSTLGTIEVRRNGTAIINLTNQNTVNGVTALVNEVVFGLQDGGGTYHMAMDDIYVLNGAGSLNNDFIGEQIIEGIETVTPDTSTTQWSPEEYGQPSAADHWSLVHEEQSGANPSRDDGAYVCSGTAGERDFYNFSDLQQITSGITAVRYMARARIESNGSRVVELQFKDSVHGTAAIDSFTVDSSTTVYTHFNLFSEENPSNPGNPYTASDINNAEIGIHLYS